MSMSRFAALGLSLLMGAGLLTACGGDDGDGGDSGGADSDAVSAESFASDVCTAISDWVTTIQEQSSEIATDFTTGSPEEGRQILEDFIDGAVQETESLISAVEDAGFPDVDGGEAFADDLQSAFQEARDVLADVRDQAAELPSDPAAFQKGAQELGTGVQEALGKVGESIEEPDSSDLQQAFEDTEACASAPV